MLLIYNVKIFVRKIAKFESKLIQLRNPEFIKKNKDIKRKKREKIRKMRTLGLIKIKKRIKEFRKVIDIMRNLNY